MFSRIYHFLKGPNPLNPSVWKGRLSPLTFRRFVSQDRAQCLELYALNEPGRFPKGVAHVYEESLDRGSSYFLVAERDGQIVASGGVSYYTREDLVVLCFGLVHPSFHGQGIGTALLLARLALLKADKPNYHVLIFAVEKSVGFYRRFGFKEYPSWIDPQGEIRPSGYLIFSGKKIHRCRALLSNHGIALPHDEDQIPVREPATSAKWMY
jgi:ribosomal protein S18 acetylase RimI-like enzyme